MGVPTIGEIPAGLPALNGAMQARRPSPTACTHCLSREQTRLKVALKARPRWLNSRP